MMDAHWHDLNKIVGEYGLEDWPHIVSELGDHIENHRIKSIYNLRSDHRRTGQPWRDLHDATAVPVDTGWHHHHWPDHDATVVVADDTCQFCWMAGTSDVRSDFDKLCTDPDCEWRRHGPN